MTVLNDGHGNQWTCTVRHCEMQIVRPGDAQCSKADCPHEQQATS